MKKKNWATLALATAMAFTGIVGVVGGATSDVTASAALEDTDLGIVITDLAKMPSETDWANATAYPLTANDTEEGATATVKIYTAAKNIFFRLEANDSTVNIINDGIYIYLGDENCYLETKGNFDTWLAHIHNDFGSPSLYGNKTTAAETQSWLPGVTTFDLGYFIPNNYEVGGKINLELRYRDSRDSSETWQDGDYAHTLVFSQSMTFGEVADTTVRPQEATTGFVGSTSGISYNKTNICWNEYTGADTYKMFLYQVNEDGSAEPYTHISTEGPIYSGVASYEEYIGGLSATTKYVVQIVAYNGSGEAIAYSALVNFSTISRAEALNPPDDGNTEEPSKGCGGTVAVGTGIMTLVGLSAFVMKKRKD